MGSEWAEKRRTTEERRWAGYSSSEASMLRATACGDVEELIQRSIL